ncbi:MAG: tryptophan--tRNA ligase [Burkholderiales bacterium]|nr:tryptophan--tRNA ligase [Burkholderiales bacterium]
MNSNQIILTGDRPTGPLHLGHLVGSLLNRVELQHTHNQFIMLADTQALTDNADNPNKVRNNIIEVALDYLAVGINPSISTIFIQSYISELTELNMYYLNLVTLARLQRNPTIKNEMQQKGFGTEVPVGFLTYPISQAADITGFKATIVPVGEDQLPLIEQTNEIVRKFNAIYGEVLVEAKGILSKTPRLSGLDGKAKMSKSLNNAIFLSDDLDIISQKVMTMYTDSNHLKVCEPGQVKGNMVFEYLDIFDQDKLKVQQLKEHYTNGGLGDVKLKHYLIEVLDSILYPIRQRRIELATDKAEILNILKHGSLKARVIANQTLNEVRNAIGVNYF